MKQSKKRIVVAIGGNALLRRGQTPSFENQQQHIALTAAPLAQLAREQELVIVHGNGPQVGLLALQAASYDAVPPYPLDALTAQTQGMLGYLLEQALSNELSNEQHKDLHGFKTVASLITRVVVSKDDPAFQNPSKPIGPVYTSQEAQKMMRQNKGGSGWFMGEDGTGMRRMVASPLPQHFVDSRPIEILLASDAVVICSGGGGIPVIARGAGLGFEGVEAVIDKDLSAALLAIELKANALLILTDVEGLYADWGQAEQRLIPTTTPKQLQSQTFAAGSMAPKVAAVCQFVEATGNPAYIGELGQVAAILRREAGTSITP